MKVGSYMGLVLMGGVLNTRIKHIEIRVPDRHRIKDAHKIYFIDAYSFWLIQTSIYQGYVLSSFLNMARELQFLIDLFRVFQIIGIKSCDSQASCTGCDQK